MFLDLLETADKSDCGWLCPAYAEPVNMRRCVPNDVKVSPEQNDEAPTGAPAYTHRPRSPCISST
jgi:hypothetical protein